MSCSTKVNKVEKVSDRPPLTSIDKSLNQTSTIASERYTFQVPFDLEHSNVYSEPQETPTEADEMISLSFRSSKSVLSPSPDSIESVGFPTAALEIPQYSDRNTPLLSDCFASFWADPQADVMNLSSRMSCTDHLTAVRDASIPPQLLLESNSVLHGEVCSKFFQGLSIQHDESLPSDNAAPQGKDDRLNPGQLHHTTYSGAVPKNNNNTLSGRTVDIWWSMLGDALEQGAFTTAQNAAVSQEDLCQVPRQQIGAPLLAPQHPTTCIGAVPSRTTYLRDYPDLGLLMPVLQYADDYKGAVKHLIFDLLHTNNRFRYISFGSANIRPCNAIQGPEIPGMLSLLPSIEEVSSNKGYVIPVDISCTNFDFHPLQFSHSPGHHSQAIPPTPSRFVCDTES